jgi:hypothetical protein
MNTEIENIARRAVACKHWRWMPGMRWSTQDDAARLDDYQPEYMGGRPSDALPDLTDAATVGCLLALVRKAWVDLHMVAHCDDRYGKTVWWLSRWGDLPRSCECSTEAAALVAALEAAP